MNVDAVIIVAMDDEGGPFLARASAVSESWRVGHAVYRRVTLAGHPILLVRSGIGLVNAAGAATSAILATEVARGAGAGGVGGAGGGGGGSVASDAAGPIVISAGTAGGVGSTVRVGDVVIGSEYINVDADARVFGYELGQVPKMPALYRAADAHIEAAARSSLAAALHGSIVDTPGVVAGAPPAAVRSPYSPIASSRALEQSDLSPALSRQFIEGAVRASVHVGLVVSSYSFVTEERASDIIREFPGALATDMESVSLAQTCHVYGRPFLSVRGISDLCGPTGADFLSHVDDAADRSAEVIIALFDALLPS